MGRRCHPGLVGSDGLTRLVVATADPGTLPIKATWYLATNLPGPGGPREKNSPHPATSLTEGVRIYGIRHWTNRGTNRSRTSWAGPTSRSAPTRPSAATRPRWPAFSFCWAAWFADRPPQHDTRIRNPGPAAERGGPRAAAPPPTAAVLAPDAARGPRLAFPPESCCGAGGPHGPRRPRRRSYKP